VSIDIEDTAIVITPANTFDTKVKHAKRTLPFGQKRRHQKRLQRGLTFSFDGATFRFEPEKEKLKINKTLNLRLADGCVVKLFTSVTNSQVCSDESNLYARDLSRHLTILHSKGRLLALSSCSHTCSLQSPYSANQ